MKKLIYILLLVVMVLFFGQRGFSQITNSGPSSACGTATGTLTATLNSGYTIVGWEEGIMDVGGFQLQNFYPSSSQFFTYNLTAPAIKTYRVRQYCCNGAYSTMGYQTISVYSIPNPGVLSGATSFMNSGSGTINHSGFSGETVNFGANSGLTSQGNGNYTYSITETKTWTASVSNGGCSRTSNPLTVKVYKKGIMTGTSSTAIGNRVTLNVINYYCDAINGWEYSTDGGTSWTLVDVRYPSYRHEITADTKFRVSFNFGQFGQVYSDIFSVTALSYTQAHPSTVFSSSDNVGNYVREHTVTVTGQTNATNVSTLPLSSRRESVTFLDGLGRPVQSKLRGATPDQKDVVGIIDYDPTGRSSKQYLPYASASNSLSFQIGYLGEQTAFYTTSGNNKVAKHACANQQTNYENSPLGKVLGGYSPGNCGLNKSVLYSTNDANEVRQFKSDGSSTAYYAANQLVKIEFVDEEGKKNQIISDRMGRTILTRSQLDEVVNGATVPWLETYYVYFENNSLRYIINPKGVSYLKSNSWNFSATVKDQYAHQFVYDERGRLIEKRVPGQAWLYYCYDPLDRLVLVQDGNLRPQYQWVFIKYDKKGRIVQNGVYTVPVPANNSRATVQTLYVNGFYGLGTPQYYENNGGSNLTFPTTNAETLTTNYYDGDGPTTTYTPQGLPNEGTPGYSLGLLSYSSRKIIGTTTLLDNYYIYDRYGRPIQIKSKNHLAPTLGQDLTTLVYDFEGKVTYKKVTKDTGGGNTVTTLNRFVYDHMGRPVQIYQKINNASTEQLVAQYEYNSMGQVVDKKLHNTTGTNFLQSVDYRYNIQGQLVSINNAQLDINAQNNDEATDYFGMEFLYNSVEAGLNNVPYSNGSLSAVKWKGTGSVAGTDDQKSYKYTYDKVGRLKTATSQNKTSSAWTKEANALNESMTYDLNGNIVSLQRNQRKHQLTGLTASYTSEVMDNLTYSYNSSIPDQLIKVEDSGIATAGFLNGKNEATEYTYNSDGSITADKNKGISSVVYNILGKPSQINFTDGHKIEYTYDAGGVKLTMKTYEGSTLVSTKDYIDGFVYENGNLSLFSSPEGRVAKNTATGLLEYQYAIADHQGNTRVVFTSVNPSKTFTATFEGNSGDNSSEFTNIDPANVVSFVAANHTTSGSKVVRMNQTYKIGPSKSLKVFPGDKVDIEVWEYHEGSTGFGSSSTPLNTLITMVAGAFGGVNGMPGEPGIIYNGVNGAIGSFLPPGNQGSARPAAYLNYILFDKDYKVLDMGWQLAPATTFTKQKLSFSNLTIKEAGYMLVYLSYDNASNNWVYFDDMKITHTQTNVIQYNEYYPFGMQTNASWTRENSNNDYLYNAGSELNRTSGWYETPFRNYDPVLGRFMSIDPLATKYASLSSYHYAGNNPTILNDPTGAAWGEQPPPGGSQEGWSGQSILFDEWRRQGEQQLQNEVNNWYAATGMNTGNLAVQAYGRNAMAQGSLLSRARNGDVDAARQYAAMNGDLLSVVGYHYIYRTTLAGSYISGTFEFAGFEFANATQGNGPLFIDGMILNTDNPYKYSPVAYFNYTIGTGEGYLAIYSGNGVRIISIDGKGNLTDRTSKVGPQIDLKKYTSNNGFTQLPRNNSRSSLEEAMGKEYADQFWQVFTNGDGYFMTDKPFKAIGAYLTDSPYSDTTFRFRFNVNNFEGHNYNVVLNVYYGQ